jgi:hypothetical protein
MTLPPAPAAPSRVPALHFGVGLLFLAGALVGLVWVAPDLARGEVFRPRVVAVAHLFTLGWLTTVIYGALGLFVPTAAGVRAWPPVLRVAVLAMHAPGVAAMGVGLVSGPPALLYAGVAAVGAGVLIVHGMLLWSALTGRGDRRIRLVLGAAALFLVSAFLMGSALAGNLQTGFLGGSRVRVVGIHLHVAALGWVMLVILAAGRRVLPMFLLAHGAPQEGWDRSALLVAGGMGLLTLGHHLPGSWVVTVSGGLAWVGVLLFVHQVAALVRHRGRALDPGMALAVGGVAVVAVALVPALLWLAGWSHPRLMPLWVTALLLGGFTPFVLGHARKMLPFQLWSLSFAAAGGGGNLPPVDALLSLRAGWGAAALSGGGVLLLLGGLTSGSTVAARSGALLMAAGFGGIVAELLGLGFRFLRGGLVRGARPATPSGGRPRV